MRTTGVAWIVAGWALAMGGGAGAGEPQGWSGEVTPYVWLANLDGEVSVEGREYDLGDSSDGVVSDLEPGGSLFATVQRGRVVAGLQMDFFDLRTDTEGSGEGAAEGHLDSELLLSQLALGWQFDGWKEGQSFTVAMGVRNLHMENDLADGGEGEVIRRKGNVTDPLLIVWPAMPLFPSKIEGLSLNPVFSLGGGGDSELIFELFSQIRYQITKHVHVRAGYRTGAYTVEDGEGPDDNLDVKMAGFTIGVGGRF